MLIPPSLFDVVGYYDHRNAFDLIGYSPLVSSDDCIPCAGSEGVDVYPGPRSGRPHNEPAIGGPPLFAHVLEQVVTEIFWNDVVFQQTTQLSMLRGIQLN